MSGKVNTSPPVFAAWIAGQIALSVAVGLATTRGPRALLGAVVLAVALALPWLAPPHVGLRFWLALISVLSCLIFVELARERRTSSPLVRVWMALTPSDVRLAARVPPRLDGFGMASGLGYALVAAGGAWLVFAVAPGLDGASRWLVRWGAGLVFGYALFEAAVHAIRVSYRALGVELPRMHDAPVLSGTVSELWSRRWNQTVHVWLRRHCFAPLARRRHPVLGVAWAFVVSAAIHAWLAFVALDLEMTAWMGGFFLVQGAAVLAERALGVARWPGWLARAWTWAVMLCSAPLFVEPFLRFTGA
ncbi:MAG: hypothetical protein EVA89_16915 [Sandaracinaceae bacterium]|nr:MAG: hypothetical protein EVA89_16915 [Sandaracinaceae bacterium]